MLKFLVEKISTHLLMLGITALTPAAAALAIIFRHELTTLVSRSTPQSLAIILVLLTLGCLALFALVIYLIPRFKYDPNIQVYRHQITGLLYCPPCRNKKPLSPLKREISGWRCTFKDCGHFYRNPDYKEPESVPQNYGPHGWMRI